jgi:hypothetical protein
MNTKEHWESIYKTKQPNEVSWTEQKPSVSLEFINKLKIPKTAKIIDIGGGDSKLVDFLLAQGYTDISVLDISKTAIISDILDFKPTEKYDLWHDRAAFHFQTEEDKINQYLNIIRNAVVGWSIIGTFSVDGPKKCSGLNIRQYDEAGLKYLLEKSEFKFLESKRIDHITPNGGVQNFIFCSFSK